MNAYSKFVLTYSSQLYQLFEPHIGCYKGLLSFNPFWQLNTMQPLTHFPMFLQWQGKENWKKVKPVFWGKNSLIIEIK